MRTLIGAALAASLALPAAAQPLRPDQLRFRALYKELVETNTTLSAGDCTLAARKMAAHLKAAGYPDSNLHIYTAPGHPKEGGLVAVLHGSDPKAKAILLLGHLDVVEAKRADWTRDPFTLIEEKGYFYGLDFNTLDTALQVFEESLSIKDGAQRTGLLEPQMKQLVENLRRRNSTTTILRSPPMGIGRNPIAHLL